MRKNFLILMLTALLPLAAFADDQDITANVKVAGTTGVVYAPVVDGKAPLKYRITKVMDNNNDGKFKSGEVEVFENGAEMKGITSITLEGEVSIPITISGGAEQTKSFKIVKIDNNGSQAFTNGNSNKLASLTIGSNVTTIAANAFKGVKALKTVTFGGNETTIGADAFSGTIISALVLPSKLVTIGNNAFKASATEYPTFSSVAIPASVQTIGIAAFEGCENLETVTFGENSKLLSIGISALAYTSLTELNLSNVKAWKQGNTDKKFETFGTADADYGPFTSADHAKTSLITSVTLPEACTTIAKSALKDVQYLNTINLSKVNSIAVNAFAGCAALAEVAIGTAQNTAITIGKGAFGGCTKLATVELGKIDAAAAIDADAFVTDPVAAVLYADEAEYNAAKGTALTAVEFAALDDAQKIKTPAVPASYAGIKTLKFNDITAAQTSKPFVNILTIEAVHFQKYLGTVDITIPDAYFNVQAVGAKLKNIYYNAATVTVPAAAKQGFHAAAFGAAATPRVATLTTKIAQFAAATGFNLNAELLNGVTIEAGYSSTFNIGYKADGAAESTRKMLKDKNSNNYYYYYKNETAGVISIAKTNGENEADVAVYQVYTDVDVTDALNIYFMPLAVVGGCYGIAANQIVIIKSNMEDAVEAMPDVLPSSTMMELSGYGVLNQLKITDAAYSKLAVMSDPNLLANGTKEIRFFNHPTNSGFGFTKYDSAKQKGLGQNTVYLQTDPVAADRVNMIWLDQNGNTTAIETIETKAETLNSAVMYNVAGQKVGADYKGLVIKDGKKFVQK